MNSQLKYIFILVCLFVMGGTPSFASDGHSQEAAGDLNVKELILEHLADSYEWHITTWGEHHISVPLLVIVKGENSGWNVFCSSKLNHGDSEYKGFYIASEGDYKGKIVEKNASGEEIRPWDISITKNAFALIICSIITLVLILSVARWYKKNSTAENPKVPGGFIGFMELFIMSVNDDIIKPCVGKNYKKFAPYLLTTFFFIFINNIAGLIPIFPFGATVTGNIAVTLVLALFTMVIVNVFGTKEYWKEIFWPEVPTWLKVPVPIMPAIEFVGIFTKPFALMIRLFANILAGHSIVLGLVCLIFVTVKLGVGINASMTLVSVLLTLFISFVEILVAYIQAYVFTMLSAVFIGLAQVEPHKEKNHK
uniref:F0F1 ATP synthase subunit A n=1 Tax=uncultured Dysgonomonas sp. TaxID=206096 RepID=UPI0026022399|nr:F0F1 ATP synthase subunit A [uncultured Dysgonomonas sp.]